MTVGELIEALRGLDPASPVVLWHELALEAQVFEIVPGCVENRVGERCKADDGTPGIRWRDGPGSTSLAVIEITDDF